MTNLIKNVLITMTLAAFAFHVDVFAQGKKPIIQETLNQLLFLTETAQGGSNLNRVDTGRSSLITQAFTQGKIKPGSIAWTHNLDTRLLTYTLQEDDNNSNLKLSIITANPFFNIKTISLPENLKIEYEFKNWIAKSQTQLFAANSNSIYQITLNGPSQSKATLIHKSATEEELDVNVLTIDDTMENLIFSYKQSTKPLYYSYNIENKKISKLDVSNSCKGSVLHLKNRLLSMGESNFLVYCTATSSARAAFLLLDFSKLTVTRFETRENLNSESDFTADQFGYYVSVTKASERVLYCNGNIKQIQSVRCLNTAMMPTGFIFDTNNLAQFYIINNRNIFALDFSTGITRRTSVMFPNLLSGNVIDPIAL